MFASLFPQDDFSLFGVILGMPLLGALINGLWGKRLGKPAVRVMAVASVTISFVCSVFVLVSLNHFVDASAHVEGGKTVHDHVRLTWTLWSGCTRTAAAPAAPCRLTCASASTRSRA